MKVIFLIKAVLISDADYDAVEHEIEKTLRTHFGRSEKASFVRGSGPPRYLLATTAWIDKTPGDIYNCAKGLLKIDSVSGVTVVPNIQY